VKVVRKDFLVRGQGRRSVSSTGIKTRALLNGFLVLETSFGVPRCSSWQCLRSGSDFMQETSCPRSTRITSRGSSVRKRNSCRAWTARSLEHWPNGQGPSSRPASYQRPGLRRSTLDRNGVTRLLAHEFIMLYTENLERLMHPLLQVAAERIELLRTPARHRKSHSLLHYQNTVGKSLVIGKNWFSEYRMQKRLRQPWG
jgi:hypothetical protein